MRVALLTGCGAAVRVNERLKWPLRMQALLYHTYRKDGNTQPRQQTAAVQCRKPLSANRNGVRAYWLWQSLHVSAATVKE